MDLTEIRSLTVSAGPHVGDLLWWALEGARIRRSDLEAIWLSEGLAPNLLPAAPTPEKALKTAVRDAQLGVDDHLIRLGKQDAQEVVFAVLHEARDPSGNVAHTQIARIQLDRGGGALLRSDNPTHDLVRTVFTGYDRMLNTHTVDDVRRTLVKTLDECAAVTLRDNGGVYWVPSVYSETIHRLQSAVGRIGQSRLDIVPIHATPEGSASLGNAAHESIEAEIATLQEEISGFVMEPPEHAGPLVRRLERCEKLRSKAELYRSVLQIQVGDLPASLDSLQATVQRLLGAPAPALAAEPIATL